MTHAVGIDVGGTKIAAGLVDLTRGNVAEKTIVPTAPHRGGAAVLADCAAIALRLGGGGLPVGIGLCELVDLEGRAASSETLDWLDLDVRGAIAAPCVVLESDVRAAAVAEARFGAGTGRSPFLHVVVGTGASVCLVVDEKPYAGARGHAIVLGAPPVEEVASGAALARLAGVDRAESALSDPAHTGLVDDAARALGGALAVLVNALDPELIVLGGGLGGNSAFRERVAAAARERVAYPSLRPLEVVGSQLGDEGGIVGAALAAAAGRSR